MVDRMLAGERRSGAIDFDYVPCSAAGLNVLINSGGDVPIQRSMRPGTFPSFKAARFSLVQDYGFIINVWCVRDDVENYQVIGGVKAEADMRDGYIPAYRRILDKILSNEALSQEAFGIIDHVVTGRLRGEI